MACLEESTVLDFVQGRLGREEISKLEQHLDVCPSCRMVVAQAADCSSHDAEATFVEGRGRAAPVKSSIVRASRQSAARGAPPASTLARGASVGRFLILQEIGAGGMGVVYAAYDPELDRKVAIKLLRWRALSEQVAHDTRIRFKREAQAMARLDHPNVISVHDVGVHGDQIFLAMELVEGWTFRGWLKEKHRGWQEILSVLRKAGEGLAAAHRAGLVHRDFKPDNVLVGRDGRVRVSDFGLARAVEELDGPPSVAVTTTSQALESDLTRVGTILGTPAYMPPEQRAGLPTDARADQFAFCVTLYEALYGSRPFGSELGQAPDGFTLPPPPKRDVPAWLHRVLARGLAASPDDRFASMDDLLRALEGPRRSVPLWARAVAVVLALSIAGAWWAYRSRQSAAHTCSDVDHALVGIWDAPKKHAVQSSILATGQPWAAAAWATVERDLDRYAAEWVALSRSTCEATQRREASSALEDLRRACLTRRLDELAAVTRVLATVDNDVAQRAVQAVQSLDSPKECEDIANLMSQVEPLLDPVRRARVQEIHALLADAEAAIDAGKVTLATEAAQKALEEAREVGYAPALAEAMTLRAALLADAGEPKAAVPMLREAVQAALRGRDDQAAIGAYTVLVTVLGSHLALFDEALDAGRTADALLARLHSPAGLRRRLLLAVVDVYLMQGDFMSAETALQQALALFDSSLPNVQRARAMDGMGDIRFQQGRLQEAKAYYREAQEIRRAALGDNHPVLSDSHQKLAAVEWGEGRYEQAIRLFQQAREVLGPEERDAPLALSLTANVGVIMVDRGQVDEGLAVLRGVLPRFEATYGRDHPEVARIRMQIGVALGKLGQYAEAESLLQGASEVFAAKEGPETIDVAMALYEQAELQRRRKRLGKAIATYSRSLAIVEATMGKDFRGAGHVLTGLGLTYLAQSRYAQAATALQRALTLREGDRIGPEKLAETRFALAQALYARGDKPQAVALARAARDDYGRASLVNAAVEQKVIDDWLRPRSRD